MRQILLALIGIVFITSCSSEKDDKELDLPQVPQVPQVYIDQLNYTLGKSEVQIKLIATEAPSEDLSIPINIGDAENGKYFKIEKLEFLLKAGEKTAILEVKRTDEYSKKTEKIQITLTQGPKYKLNLRNYCIIDLLGEENRFLLNFEKTEGELKYITPFGIIIEDKKGGRYKVSKETSFKLEVDPSSTAVLGEHFELLDNDKAIVPFEKKRGSFRVKFLKKEAGKDKIVLRFAKKEGFDTGTNDMITIMIKGAIDYSGTWVLKEISDSAWLEDPNNGYGVTVAEIMDIKDGDKISFEGNPLNYKLRPNLTGKLKNFFVGECNLEYHSEREERLQESENEVVILSRYKTKDVNVLFSPNKDKKRSTFVDFRMIKQDGKDILECTLADFEPTTEGTPTWKALYEFMGKMTWTPIRLHFERE